MPPADRAALPGKAAAGAPVTPAAAVASEGSVPPAPSPPPHASAGRRVLRRARLLPFFLVILLGGALAADWWIGLPAGATAHYVGRDRCLACHQDQARLWTGSHHDLAMDVATPTTVLGDFQDATLEHHGITSRMFRRGEDFFVHTEGPDGKMADFQVRYVLGVTPLQQYMVEFDRQPDQPPEEIARLQVLRISWDTLARRWFHLDPPDVTDKLAPNDELHWTGILQRWNNMCADCHSTNLQRRYDPQTGTYHTTFQEIDVSCEACHGPGSLHVQLAEARSLFWDRQRGYALATLKGTSNTAEIQACAPCHSRRGIVSPEYHPGDNYYDGFQNELLGDLTYHADGQILDEVYEYGSFLQSKMYHKGIKCSNCHDPHSLRVRFPDNRLCTSCHAHPAGKYDGPGHHHHAPNGTGAQCVNCHMPVTKYMAVDPRRDHSLRIPRPALSVDLGTPNACTGCHLEIEQSRQRIAEARRPALQQYADWLKLRGEDQQIRDELARLDQWARTAARRWWGDKAEAPDHYAYTLHAARTQQPDAATRLTRLATNRTAPAIVRATALEYLANEPTEAAVQTADKLLDHPDAQLQLAALRPLEARLAALDSQLDPQLPLATRAPLYRDLVRSLHGSLASVHRSVRFAAARILVRVPEEVRSELLAGPDRDRLDAILDESLAAQTVNADRAEMHLGAAQIHESRGRWEAAIAAYETAIRVEPQAVGARGNLAALYDRLAELAVAQRQTAELRREARRAAQLVEEETRCRKEAQRLRAEELPLLARHAQLAPQLAPVQYRYAMALYVNGRESDAEQTLRQITQLDPRFEDAWLALALLLQKQQRRADARACVEQLLRLRPGDPRYAALAAQLAAP
ncbi:MAG: multiheme c-type cytochrome [Pirellulales bacterium]